MLICLWLPLGFNYKCRGEMLRLKEYMWHSYQFMFLGTLQIAVTVITQMHFKNHMYHKPRLITSA